MDEQEIKISNSKNIEDYEILIRKRGNDDFASYCPQLNIMFKAATLTEVRRMVKAAIEEHIGLNIEH
ncbi:MAG TPA: hypothetical protein PKY56_04020 [Candidatus Kapabacteria bacterium]|nr:hypothetical protein [Candidatus Kapabacteria bacterium]HPO61718.1 hypothetical protein [Candidatus Kapabacteria bacterium]